MRRFVAGALRDRRNEVASALAEPPRHTGAGQVPVAGDGGEEELRVFMVRLWPAARGDSSAEERERLLGAALGLETGARDDLRFLDAWNNAYEALVDWREG